MQRQIRSPIQSKSNQYPWKSDLIKISANRFQFNGGLFVVQIRKFPATGGKPTHAKLPVQIPQNPGWFTLITSSRR